jgi:hypothetical protein
MGAKYTVQAWGKHFGDADGYQNLATYQGNSLLRALWETWKARRRGFGCVTLEIRG